MTSVVNRRAFISSVAGGLLVAPLAAEAQQAGKVWRIGFLSIGGRPVPGANPGFDAFLQGLRELGYVDGQNVVIEHRFAEGRPEGLPTLAVELVSLHVDVIIAPGTAATRVSKGATATIPIVMVFADEPVLQGFVGSLARPGGNITGLSAAVTPELWSKRLQLLTEVSPSVSRVAYLWTPGLAPVS